MSQHKNCASCGTGMLEGTPYAGGRPRWNCLNPDCPRKKNRPAGSSRITAQSPSTDNQAESGPTVLFEENQEERTGTVTYHGGKAPSNKEIFRMCGLDPDVWEVTGRKVKTSQVSGRTGARREGKNTKYDWGTFTNVHLSLTLRKRGVDSMKAVEGAVRLLRENAPGKPGKASEQAPGPKSHPDSCMLELGLVDHHFGMLSWSKETGQDYDLKIAEHWYERGIRDMLEKTAPFYVDKILMPVGHDFLHCNDPTYLTPAAGNRLDMEGRYSRIFEVAISSAVRAVQACLERAPVEVVLVPGNHDPQTSYHVAKYIEAWFRNDSRVEVDAGPNPVKYRDWGINLLGMVHGAVTKPDRLPSMLLLHNRKKLQRCSRYEMHIGHFHSRGSWKMHGGMEEGGVTVRTLPSLASKDFWTHSKGWERTHRAVEGYLWGMDKGYHGHFSCEYDMNEAADIAG